MTLHLCNMKETTADERARNHISSAWGQVDMALANLRSSIKYQHVCVLLEEAKSYIESAETEMETEFGDESC